jgi:hypothetical protein
MSAIDFDMTMERSAQPEGEWGEDHDVVASFCRSILRRDFGNAGIWVRRRGVA